MSILESLDSDRAADIVEEMDPDAAADLLGDLPEDEARKSCRRCSRRSARRLPSSWSSEKHRRRAHDHATTWRLPSQRHGG